MSIISVAAAREHLRLGDETSDGELAPLIAAAEAGLADFLGRPLEPGDWAGEAAVPENVIHAAKLILSELYEERSTPIADMMSVRTLCGRYLKVGFA